MNAFIVVSALIPPFLYLPLCRDILRGRVRQNLATWGLFTVLDGIAAGSLYVQNGGWELPAVFCVGASCVSLCIMRARSIHWTWFETFISALTVASMVIWQLTEAELATIMSTTALAIATLPTICDAYWKPEKQSMLAWSGFLISNVLSVMGGREWSIQERLFPGVGVLATTVLVALTARKYMKRR